MNANIKWNQPSSLSLGRESDDPWLGTPLGQSVAEYPMFPANPFAFAAPRRRARVSWVGEVGVGASASGLTVPQLKETTSFKTCFSTGVVKCHNTYSDPKQAQDCDQGAEQLCLQLADKDEAAKKGGGAASQTTQQITNLQNTINAELTKLGICNIGVDGKVGPTTCRAAEYLAKQGKGVYVPGICSSKTGAGAFDPNCKLGQKPGPPVSPCAACKADEDCVDEKCVPKCPAGQERGTDGKCAAKKTAGGSETPWGLFALATAAAGAIFLAVKAPKMPPREAERPADNPRRKRRRRAA